MVLFVGILLVIPTILLKGLVLQQLWEWFIVPTFYLHPLTLIQSIGIGFVISILTYTYHYSQDDRNEWDKLLNGILSNWMIMLFTLIYGYIFHFFM